MDGRSYQASRFAATLRRQLYKEHLGLISPQRCESRQPQVTSFMRGAPYPNEDQTDSYEDRLVADPLSNETDDLWTNTARKNREIFTEVFRPIPTNLVRSWAAYDSYKSKVKTGHVVPDIPIKQIKSRLGEVKGHLVEAALDFLIDEHDFTSGTEWSVLNPALPLYV